MNDELHLISPREGLAIRQCLAKLRYFCEYDAYQGYDLVGLRYLHETDRLRPELLRAVNKAMLARSSNSAWQPFLTDSLPELAAIPTELDLVDSLDSEYETAREALRAYYAKLSAVKWINDMAASKMLFLKRPRLVAISDSYVRAALGVEAREPRNAEECAERALATSDAVRSVGKANLEALENMQRELDPLLARLGEQKSVKAVLSKARIIDILAWTDMAIAASHRMWTPVARALGWQTIAGDVSSRRP